MMPTFEPRPLHTSRLFLQRAAPFARALGLELMEWGAGRALTRVTPSERIARALDDPRPHPLALIGIVDHSFSYAISGVVGEDVGMSTLDLRIGFAARGPGEGDVRIETRTVMLDDHTATGQSHVTDGRGETLAIATALFTLGSFTGGAAPADAQVGVYDPASRGGPFTHLIGLGGEPGALRLEAGNATVIGWESGQTLHGGSIGALLMAACLDRAETEGDLAADKRLASLYVRYLRPAPGEDLHARSATDRKGRTTSYIAASCFNQPGKDVAAAHATFVLR